MKNFGNLLLACMAALLGACAGESAGKCDAVVRIDADSVVNRGYIGNGVQWDPYALDYGQGRVEISDADWAKLYARLDFMRPAFIRVMTNTTSVVRNGRLDRMRGFEHLSHILGYCQSRGVTVMFGDWGGSLMDARAGTVNRTLLDHAAAYVAWLVGEKGYDCIRYYNLVNEPNGFWSAADGDFDLWAKAVSYFRGRLDAEGLAGKVELVGPDAAIWGPEEAWWVSRSRDELGDRIGLYDIHTYPSKCTVNSGEYTRILEAYRREVPAGKKIVMGEIGFKFVEPADSLLQAENLRRAAAHPNASTDDSQMFVYDPMYGTDMADALFQTIHAGYSGCIAWMLDDAMHFKEAPDKLKIWGFWNIFGDEIFGFTTVSGGITIHRQDCPNAQRLKERYPYRVLPARWQAEGAKGAFRAAIRIQADDLTGLVNKIAEVINRDLKINIRSMSLNSSGGTLSGLINIEVTSTQVVDAVIYSLMRIKGVQKVFRVNN